MIVIVSNSLTFFNESNSLSIGFFVNLIIVKIIDSHPKNEAFWSYVFNKKK